MQKKHRARRLAMAVAHRNREDNRRSEVDGISANDRRNQRRDARRAARRSA